MTLGKHRDGNCLSKFFYLYRVVLETSLDTLHEDVVMAIKNIIKTDNPKAIAISSDGWMDAQNGYSYLNYDENDYIRRVALRR